MRSAALALLLLAAAAPAAELWPGTRYDPEVPTLEEVAGHGPGDEITPPEVVTRYLEALAAAVPRRTHLVEYARSWQGRPLHYLVIGSAANVDRLEAIRAGMQRLADPRGAAERELDTLLADLPAVVWLAHGVHGDEISSTDAALLSAYHLLAATSAEVAELLERVLVVIDPLQNPDGRARFVHHYRSTRGLTPEPSPIAAERVQTWPGGRTNHYLFDLNRDWFALTQPEVRGRVRAFLDYYPLVHVDLHEMGTDSTYFFAPPAEPWNPWLEEGQRASLEALGRGVAAMFDRFGFRYYTREIFDAYYPGYGDTWPSLQGAAGMTFEMASARGLAGQRADGSVVSYADGVRRHFVASMGTLATAAERRHDLLEGFLAARRGAGGNAIHVLSRDRDAGRADKLAGVLTDQGVEVRRLPAGGRLCGREFTAGAYAVAVDQPAGRLAGTLLAPESPADAGFWEEQERRAGKRLPLQVYDVVAWSLPLLYDVPHVSCAGAVAGLPLAAQRPVTDGELALEPALAYLVPWGSQAAARLLAAALREGLQVHAATAPLRHATGEFPRGTLILRRDANGDDLPRRMAALAARTGAAVSPIASAWMRGGIDLGSDRVRPVPATRVALAWDEPTSVTSAGAWRYLLEQKLGHPVTPVRVEDLASPWLDQYHVLVLPEGGDYGRVLREAGRENLLRWVRGGGTLVGVGGALEFLADSGLLTARLELRAAEDGAGGSDTRDAPGGDAAGQDGSADDAAMDDSSAGPVPGTRIADDADRRAALRPDREPPRALPGVLLRASLDADHWLSAGLPEELPFMVTGQRIFTPLRLDKGTNVAAFAAAERLHLAGRLWEENRAQLAHKPVVMVERRDRGQVVAFVADPAFRGMMDGLDVLVANAVFFGPAMTRRVPAPPASVAAPGLGLGSGR